MPSALRIRRVLHAVWRRRGSGVLRRVCTCIVRIVANGRVRLLRWILRRQGVGICAAFGGPIWNDPCVALPGLLGDIEVAVTHGAWGVAFGTDFKVEAKLAG